MLAYDVFTDDAFTAIEVQEAVDNIVYIPQTLNSMGIFTPDPIVTTSVAITRRGESLELVPTSERGSQPALPARDKREMRRLDTLRLAQEDRINSHELQNIAPEGMPFEVALDRGLSEVDKRQRKLMRKLELTREYHRLAAIQGYVLDADGSIIMDFYDEFQLVRPAAVEIDPTLIEGDFRKSIHQLVTRPMTRQLAVDGRGGLTRIVALCGDEFYDEIITAKEIRETYLIAQQGRELREGFQIWEFFDYGGVRWMNYRGTNDNTTIKIPDDECIFFPIGVEDMFVEFRAPGEDMNDVNKPGKEFYSYVSPDYRPNMFQWVDVYLFAYPLFACLAPGALLRGILAA